MKPSAPGRSLVLFFAALVGAVPAALAQAMTDPTRPPNVTGSEQAEAEPPAFQLQSVLISQGRRLAIVNGQTVKVGDKLGDAIVKSIGESGVMLEFSDHRETLSLLGDVKRQPVRAPRSPAMPGAQGGAR